MKEIEGHFYERQRVESAWEEVCKRYAQEAVKEAAEIPTCYMGIGETLEVREKILNIIKELK